MKPKISVMLQISSVHAIVHTISWPANSNKIIENAIYVFSNSIDSEKNYLVRVIITTNFKSTILSLSSKYSK